MATQNEKILAGVLVATIIVAAIVIGLIVSKQVTSHGKIKTIGCEVWANANRTIILTDIDWGFVSPGDIKGVGFWVQNTGNVNVTLSLNVTSWNPLNASSYIVVTWNYTAGTVVLPFEMVPIQLRLSVSPSITGITDFSNTIWITATEVKP
jgi:hypothetical protein